jgi:hypothetical protein
MRSVRPVSSRRGRVALLRSGLGSAWLGSAWLGSVRLGSGLGSAFVGSIWLGSAWLGSVGCVLASPADSQTLLERVRPCAAEQDAASRLACYDREVKSFLAPATESATAATSATAASGTTSTPAATAAPGATSTAAVTTGPGATSTPAGTSAPGATTTPAATATPSATATSSAVSPSPTPGTVPPVTSPSASAPDSPEDRFGANAKTKRNQGPQPVELDKLDGRIVAVSYRPRGESVVTLENGQIWEEAEVESHLPLRPGESITIRRGVLGAFYLSSDKVLGLRVRRLH